MYLEEYNDWRFTTAEDPFSADAYYRELYYFHEQVKDGDLVVVYSYYNGPIPQLDLGSKSLNNLTVVHTDTPAIIYCGAVENFYALANTVVSVNSPAITTADVYDNTTCNFNSNVGTLNFYITGEIDSIVGCSGTVGHLYGYSLTEERVYYDFYDFKADTLRIYDGGFQTPDGYSRTAPVATPAPAAPSGSASSGNDYDDVPKTGDSSTAMWLLFAAALCAGGSFYLGKKSR